MLSFEVLNSSDELWYNCIMFRMVILSDKVKKELSSGSSNLDAIFINHEPHHGNIVTAQSFPISSDYDHMSEKMLPFEVLYRTLSR